MHQMSTGATQTNRHFHGGVITFVSVLIVMVTFVLVFCTSDESDASAVDSGSFGDGLAWQLDDKGKLTVSGNGAIPDYDDRFATPWLEPKSTKITSF